jgi:transposase
MGDIMSYSIDFRTLVVDYVRGGGLKSEASRLFGVCRPTIYHWLSAEDLTPRPAKTRKRKLDKVALAAHVRDHSDMLLRERAAHFGVRVNSIGVALQKLRISKKNDEIF